VLLWAAVLVRMSQGHLVVQGIDLMPAFSKTTACRDRREHGGWTRIENHFVRRFRQLTRIFQRIYLRKSLQSADAFIFVHRWLNFTLRCHPSLGGQGRAGRRQSVFD
jgi:hypothetical protein